MGQVFAAGFGDDNGIADPSAVFAGDGSKLTNLTVSGAVAKSGDDMTGPLGISYDTATDSLKVLNANAGGRGAAAFFHTSNAGNASDTLYVQQDGTGVAGNFYLSSGGNTVWVSAKLWMASPICFRLFRH